MVFEHLSDLELATRLRTLPANWHLARSFYTSEQERRDSERERRRRGEPEPEQPPEQENQR